MPRSRPGAPRRSGTVAPVATVALVLLGILGCASAPIVGRVSSPGRESEIDRAILNYRSSLLGGSGKLWTTLPPGETFTGRYELQPRTPEAPVIGTLTGDRGNTMTCQFMLNEPGVGPDKGGTVRCEVSTGAVFTASF
jgi:hypothetical protein